MKRRFNLVLAFLGIILVRSRAMRHLRAPRRNRARRLYPFRAHAEGSNNLFGVDVVPPTPVGEAMCSSARRSARSPNGMRGWRMRWGSTRLRATRIREDHRCTATSCWVLRGSMTSSCRSRRRRLRNLCRLDERRRSCRRCPWSAGSLSLRFVLISYV